jgi:hypothetical protein
LLAQQLTDPSSSSYGLLRGGPDAQWVSTQHNLIARAFFRQLANTITATGTRCRGGLTGLSTSDANAFAATLRSVVSAMDAGIDHSLFVRVSSSGAYFRQGVGDDVEPLDAQALGILYLNGVARTGDAAAVRNFTNSAMALTGGIALSSNPASYNQTYSAAGPFTGYRPYGNPTAPDVLWMEGTLEMRLAMARSGVSTSALDPSLTAWYRLTGSAGPLQANAVVTGNPFNEYHVWPAASAAAWALLNLTNFGSLLQ